MRFVVLSVFSLALALSSGCGDPCDGDEAHLGDVHIQSDADADVLAGGSA